MARSLINCFGPEMNFFKVYSDGPNTGLAYSLTTSPAPPQGTYWIQCINPTQAQSIGQFNEIISNYQVYWLCIRGYRIEGTITTGDTFPVMWFKTRLPNEVGALHIQAVGQSDGTYKLAMTETAGGETGTTTTTFSVSTTYAIRWEINHSQMLLWVNGTLELTVAVTAYPKYNVLTLEGMGKAGVTVKWNRVGLYGGVTSDRPGTNIWIGQIDPTSEGTNDAWGTDADCADGLADFSNWDDFVSGGAPDTVHNIACAGDIKAHTSNLSTVTPTGSIDGVKVYTYIKTNVASKTVNSSVRIRDTSNLIDKANNNLDFTTYVNRNKTFELAPGGVAWTQGAIDSLQAGLTKPDSAGAGVQCAAIAVEVVASNNDPPPVPIGKLRQLNQSVNRANTY